MIGSDVAERLVSSGFIRKAVVFRSPVSAREHWCIGFGTAEGHIEDLCNQRKSVRSFASIDSAAKYLRSIGIVEFEVSGK